MTRGGGGGEGSRRGGLYLKKSQPVSNIWPPLCISPLYPLPPPPPHIRGAGGGGGGGGYVMAGLICGAMTF